MRSSVTTIQVVFTVSIYIFNEWTDKQEQLRVTRNGQFQIVKSTGRKQNQKITKKRWDKRIGHNWQLAEKQEKFDLFSFLFLLSPFAQQKKEKNVCKFTRDSYHWPHIHKFTLLFPSMTMQRKRFCSHIYHYLIHTYAHDDSSRWEYFM